MLYGASGVRTEGDETDVRYNVSDVSRTSSGVASVMAFPVLAEAGPGEVRALDRHGVSGWRCWRLAWWVTACSW